MKPILNIYTTDKKIEHEVISVRIFTLKYSKKIKKNEFHCPQSAKLIVETKNHIYSYIMKSSIIDSDGMGNIKIYSPTSYEEICKITPETDKQKLLMAKYENKMYKNKEKLGLSVDEVIEKFKVSSYLETEKIKKMNLSYEKGGGF